MRVAKDGAFAAAVLDTELTQAAQLDARDRALATELALGALRVLPWLEARIGRHAKRGLASIDPAIRAHLVVAAYQLFFLDRVPSFAAVSEAVSNVRALRGEQVGGFANAVLRKLADEATRERPSAEEAAAASAAPWLRDALTRTLGDEGAKALLARGAALPPAGLRVERAEERASWILRLREALPDAAVEAGTVSPLAIVVRGGGRLSSLPGHGEGAWTIQEEGSQLVALALGPRPGEVLLDACAGRGNKTAILARGVAGAARGAVDAADLHGAKLDRLQRELQRVGLSPRGTFAVDWTVGSGDVEGLYDGILVDAPCSGVGTLARRPDLATRRTAEDLPALATLQRSILTHVLRHLRPGGRLVYAVCSVLREEGEDVVEAILQAHPRLTLAPFSGEAARALAGEGSTLRLLPHVHGTDGYFLASFRDTMGPPEETAGP